MRLITRNDASLVVGLIAGTVMIFQRPLRVVWELASAAQDRYQVDLLPALTIFAGVLIFHFDRTHLRKMELQRAFWFFAILLALSFYYPARLPPAVHIAFIVLVSPLVVLTGSRVRLSGKWQSIATLSGALSYPVYVLHYPIFCWINGFYQFATKQPQNIYFEGVPLLAGILIGSYFLLKVFDEPIRYALSHGTWPTLRGSVKKA